MSKIIKGVDGKYYLMRTFEVLSEAEVIEKIAELNDTVAELQAIAPQVEVDPVTNQITDPVDAPTAATPEVSAALETPVQEVSAPAPQAEVAPVDPAPTIVLQ